MRKILLFGLLLGLSVVVSGCVAMQEDVSTLQERVATTETKLEESKQSMVTFESDWNPKVAGLSEDMLGLRERIASVEGSLSTLSEQIRQETEKSEKFRSSTSQELNDFQRGVSERLEQMRRDLDLMKKTQTETIGFLEVARKQMDKINGEYAAISDRVDQVDTGFAVTREETTKKRSIIVEEVSKENQSLRERIEKLEKKLSIKPVVKKKTEAPQND